MYLLGLDVPLIMALCIAVGLALSSTGGAVTLAEQGQTHAQIVLPSNPSTTERFAARELQSYIQQIFGAELPIVHESDGLSGPRLLIGATVQGIQAVEPLAGMDPDTYILQSAGDTIVLAGAQYVHDENEKEPHHATAPGKLISVYQKNWEQRLEAMR